MIGQLLLLGVMAAGAGCTKGGQIEQPQPAPIVKEQPDASSGVRRLSWVDIGRSDLSFGTGMRGQLDRIDAVLSTPLPTELVSAWAGDSTDNSDRIRSIVRDDGRAKDARMYAAIAGAAVKRAVEAGTVVYPMLTKNASRYTGRPWLLVGARLRDVHESSGVTVARTEFEPGSGPLMIAGRFSVPFVDGDRVDVIGYLAGEDLIAGHAYPVMAAAAILPAGAIDRINGVEKLWTKTLTAHTLGSLPRGM